MRTERRKLKDLQAYPKNNRRISERAKVGLTASIKKFGLVQDVVVNERTGFVVGGHRRIEVLMDLGETEIDVKIGDWDPEEEAALNAALNNPHIQGTFTGEARQALEELSDKSDALFQSLNLSDLRQDMRATRDVSEKIADGLTGKASPLTAEKIKQSFIRPALLAQEIDTVEKALSLTGKEKRSEALLEICQDYIGKNE